MRATLLAEFPSSLFFGGIVDPVSTAATTKRGPYARTQQRRDEIARAVLQLIEELGHESVTIAMVAERSETSEATVLYHFPSRDHLLVAALERSDQLSSAAANAEDEDAVLSLERFRDTALPASQSDHVIRLLLTLKGQAVTPDHPAAEYFTRRNAHQIEIFTRLIARRQRDGFAHPGLDSRRTAIEVIAIWDGLTALWLTDPTFDVADMLIDAYRRLAGENIVELRKLLNSDQFGL
jgi:AcrR family transcriptional regulator